MIRHLGSLIIFVGFDIVTLGFLICFIKEILAPAIKDGIKNKCWIGLFILFGFALLVIGGIVSLLVQ